MKLKLSFDYISISILTAIVVLIYFINYHGDFWITGWDNLHPEFNFSLNIQRALFSSWQEYQGLGLPAGNGHATELSRAIILWVFNLLVPSFIIRKLFIILMLYAGALGMYFFTRDVIFKKIHYDQKILLSFVSALFYMLHLTSIQIFYVPYEAFIAHYGLLPWMIYSIYNYVYKPTKKSLLFLILIQFLGTWQFYIPTLFLVYGLVVIILLCVLVFQNIANFSWRRGLATLIIIGIVNLYWLLPFTYYTLTNIQSQQNAYLNLLYTEDTYTQSAKYGTWEDATLFKNYLFDYVTPKNNGEPAYMMGSWIPHIQSWYFKIIGYTFFCIVLWGGIYCIRKRKDRYIVVLFFLFFTFIANQSFPFSAINILLRHSELFDQIFRNPFTKFANTALFFMAILFSYGLLSIAKQWESPMRSITSKVKGVKYYVISVVVITFFIYTFPIWRGLALYPALKTSIPHAYFKLFDFFQHQKNGRIANFPQYTPNGWQFYRWGYQGSGFLWYGIKQPILDRAFDVWNKSNENYYWEISQVVYSQNQAQFERLLDKYQISWILLDKNVVSTQSYKSLYKRQLESMLAKSQKITDKYQFGNISIYRVNLNTKLNSYISTTSQLPEVQPPYMWSEFDQAYIDIGAYITSRNNISHKTDVYYPFRSLFTGREQEERKFTITQDKDNYYFISHIPPIFDDTAYLYIPKININEITELSNDDLQTTTLKSPKIRINKSLLNIKNYRQPYEYTLNTSDTPEGWDIEIIIPKIQGYYSGENIPATYLEGIQTYNCNKFNNKGNFYVKKLENNNAIIELYSLSSNNCFNIKLPHLSQKNAYLITVPARNIQGKSLLFSIVNRQADNNTLATYLPKIKQYQNNYFIIPPKEPYGLGYNMHLDNISLDSRPTINQLGKIKINPIPYHLLTSIKVIKNHSILNNKTINKNPISQETKQKTSFRYITKLNHESSSDVMILYQSFHPGWKAYKIDCQISNVKCQISKWLPMFFGTELTDHVLVNNWANGWKLPATPYPLPTQIVIIFWPQYLQFAGFGLLVIVIIWITFKDKRRLLLI